MTSAPQSSAGPAGTGPRVARPSWIRPVPEGSGGLAERGANDYDSFAEAYSAENESSLINAYYERPAMLDLAGDVVGRRILDAGCGSGPCPRRCASAAPR